MARLKTDWVLFLTTVLMVCFGLVMVYSASSVMAELKYQSNTHFFVRQLFWGILGFVILMYFKRHDYRTLRSPVWAFGSLSIVVIMLVAVYFADSRQHRWFRVPGVGSLQPSEFAKPALAIFLAYFLTLRAREVNNRHIIRAAGLVLIMLAVMVGLADLGTAIVLIATAAVVFYVAGLNRTYIVVAVAAGILFGGIFVVAKPYRMARIIGYVDPDYKYIDLLDPNGRIKRYVSESITTRDPSYQARQSKIAVGSGGPLGLGLMQSKQKLLYLPEAHTDFIYAVVGEELGLFGCTAVLAGFLIICWRGLRLYWAAPDEFGRYLALGLTASIVVQALINISVVLDMGPTKGIPLPMISAGGSSLLSTLMSLGMLLSVSEHAS